jgi:hypothetical protein
MPAVSLLGLVHGQRNSAVEAPVNRRLAVAFSELAVAI